MRRFLLGLFSLFLYLHLSSLSVYASDFSATHDITYTYSTNGTANVVHKIGLTNLVSKSYPIGFQLILHGDPPTNLSGLDSHGSLHISSQPTSLDSTLLDIKLNDQIVGKNNTTWFTLYYQLNSAKKTGQIWEISLPKYVTQSPSDNYLLKLHVPIEFGKLAFMSPAPDKSTDGVYEFSGRYLPSTGVSAAFGNFASYRFDMNYRLENPHNKSSYAYVILPSDTSYQKLYYTKIDPQPSNVSLDDDGNWLASYYLKPKESISISAVGHVHILSSPSLPQQALNPSIITKLLSEQKYWPVGDPQIVPLANDLKTPQQIFNFVSRTLVPIPQSTSRQGALSSLSQPKNTSSLDSSDLFITLCRSAGIPSRQVTGVLTDTPSTLYTWSQYYDPDTRRWTDIDTNSGFDLKHFSLVTSHTSSYSPSGLVSVKMSPSDYQDFPLISPTTIWHKPFQLLPFITNHSQVEIINNQGQAYYYLPVSLSSSGLLLRKTTELQLSQLPPFSRYTLPVEFSPVSFVPFSPKYLTINVGNSTLTYNISVSLFIVWIIFYVLLISTLITGLAALAHHAWSLHLQRRSR